MVGRAGGDRVRLATGGLDIGKRLLPTCLEADAESLRHHPDVGTKDAAEQDVANLVIDRIGPVDPALLHEDALHADVGSDRRYLPRVI